MATTTDRDLARVLDRLAKDRGDEEAWAELFDRAWPYALGVTFRRLRGQRRLAEDAAQEALTRLVRYADFERLRDPVYFRRYLAATAANVAASHYQATRRRGEELSLEQGEAVVPPAAGAQAERAEVGDLLRKALETLDDSDRRLVGLLAEGRSLQELADRLGISSSAAGVRVHRLRQRLKTDPAWAELREIVPDL